MKTLLLIAGGEKVFMDACAGPAFSFRFRGTLSARLPCSPRSGKSRRIGYRKFPLPLSTSGSVDENIEEF